MDKKQSLRHALGYTLGFSVFVVIIPLAWIVAAGFFRRHIDIGLINNHGVRLVLAIPLVLLGFMFVVWSNAALLKFGQGGPADVFNVAVSPRTKKLVIIGPYRYSRNPMVFGMLCVYLALVILLNSLPCLVLLALFVLMITVYLRFTEEKRLLKDFGESFLEYKKNVPMILPNVLKIRAISS